MTKPKIIYCTRARCEEHQLDKAMWFYRVPNATPVAMHNAHKKVLRKRFKEKYGCEHKITFTKEMAKDYLWDVDNNKPIKREGF
jgi:hypothetical protein